MMMTFTALVAEAQRLSDEVTRLDRDGRVNTRGWDEQGNPLGGHLTWDAMGCINAAEGQLCDIGACGGCRFCS